MHHAVKLLRQKGIPGHRRTEGRGRDFVKDFTKRLYLLSKFVPLSVSRVELRLPLEIPEMQCNGFG